MFSKSNKAAAKPKPSKAPSQSPAKPAAPTIISKDLRIVGNLRSDGEIQIDAVIIHGTVDGRIESRSVKLARTAHVVGDILHGDLAIETGAFLEGHCKRIQEDLAPKQVVDAQAEAKTAVPAMPAKFGA